MATRLYFGSVGVHARQPAFDASWEVTAAVARRTLRLFKEGTPHTNFSQAGSGVVDQDSLVAQFISPPLQAGNISGTVKSYIQALESAAGDDARAQLNIRVLSSDGTVVRGTLLAHDVGALTNEFDAVTRTNRAFPVGLTNNTLTLVAAQDQDILVVEVGARIHSTSLGPISLRFGDSTSLADLAENEVDTADGVPWIEFSQTLLFENHQQYGPTQISPDVQIGSFDRFVTGGGFPYSPLNTTGIPEASDLGETIRLTQCATRDEAGAQGGNSPSLPVRFYKLRAFDTVALSYVVWVSRYLSVVEAPGSGSYSDLAVVATWEQIG